MLEPPISSFIVGVLISEVLQYVFWVRKAGGNGRTTRQRLHGYFTEQTAALIGNLAVDFGICWLWAYQGLDTVLAWSAAWIPGADEWAVSGVPFTPQVGLLLGAASDFFGDDVAFNVVEFIRPKVEAIGRVLGVSTTPPPKPPTGGDSEIK